MTNTADYIIIGNGVAGIAAIESIREIDRNGSIAMFSDEKHPFYARIRLPQFLAGEVALEQLILRDINWHKEQKVDLRLNEPVVSADPSQKTITTKSGELFSYKKLLLANGANSFVPPLEGSGLEGVFTLRNIDDAIAIKEYVKGKKRGVIIGGGLLGLEAGKAFLSLGIKVCVIEFSNSLLPRQVDAGGGGILKSLLEKMGYSFRLGAKTEKITRDNNELNAILNDGAKETADFVLISAGVRPNLTLPLQMNIATNKGVIVNDFMQTNIPDVFSAGDVTEHNGKLYGIWPAAKEQGGIAGKNMAGVSAKHNGATMQNTLKVAGVNLFSIGDIQSVENAECVVTVDKRNGIYKKYITKNNALVGAIMIGDTSEQKKAEQAVKEKKPLF